MTQGTTPPLPEEAVHLSYDPGAYRMAMGLVAADPATLIELDSTYPAQIGERRRLLAERRADVLAMPPGTEGACAELLDRVGELLALGHPEFFARDGAMLRNRITGEDVALAGNPDPLAALGRTVAEDFCLIRPDPAGPILAAAILCFPSRWVLAEKLARPLLEVHARVPGYAKRLGAPVDRFFSHLKPGRMAVRLNWTVIDDPALFQLSGKFSAAADRTITADNALDRLHLRVERQTFLLLPSSGMVSFGIRTHVYPLTRIAALPGEAARLAAAVRALPPEMALYKSLGRFRDALLAALDAIPSPA
jgi:hypothetical protein